MDIKYEMKEELSDDAVIVLDSTGIKVTSRGEWMGHRKRISK